MERLGMITTRSDERLQLRTYFERILDSRPDQVTDVTYEPVFREFTEFLKLHDVEARLVNFNKTEHKLSIYLNDETDLSVLEEGELDITNFELGAAIVNKWKELSSQWSYLLDFEEKIDVKFQNFNTLYFENLVETAFPSIMEKIMKADLRIKPNVLAHAKSVISLIYLNQYSYEQAISCSCVFKAMDIIDEELTKLDTLGIYYPKTVKLNVLHSEMPDFNLLDFDETASANYIN